MDSNNRVTKYPVNEIFYSIQGEGWHTGKPAVFIRLAGCNLKCEWCDTKFDTKAIWNGKDIVNQIIGTFPDVFAPLIVITGGEPTIHNLLELCGYIKCSRLGLSSGNATPIIAVETNGLGAEQLISLQQKKLINWVTVSPKPTAFYDTICKQGFGLADEIKIVFDGVINPLDFEQYIPKQLELGRAYIQPCSENFRAAVDFVMANPKWRLSIQVQKVIGAR